MSGINIHVGSPQRITASVRAAAPSPAERQVVFSVRSEFPAVGSPETLYIATDEGNVYYYAAGTGYVNVGGGDVTKAYVDAQDDRKADKVTNVTVGNLAGLDNNGNLTDSGKSPSDISDKEISSTATGTAITLTNSADGYLQGITIKGHSEAVDGEIRSIGDPCWGVVDLGTLTWTLYDTTETRSAFYCTVSGSTTISDPTAAPDFICSAFNVIAYTSSWTPGTITQGTNGVVIVNADPSITTAQALAAVMSGVLLYYHFADALFVSPRLGITCKNGAGQGTAATITTGLPLRSTLDGTVYDELTNDSVITRCEVVNGEVVAKATPVITPLTPTEKTVLASLRTYNPNTQIDVTDSPSMTVNYLLNTDNGQAAAKIDSKIPQVINETVTLAYFRWNGNSAPYTQTVIVPGVLASDKPIIDVSISNNVATGISEAEQWSKITKAVTGNGHITFSCYEEMPGIDLVVNVKVVR